MNLRSLIDEFVNEQELRGNSPITVESYRYQLRRLTPETTDEFTSEWIANWRKGLMESGLSRHSVFSYNKTLRIFSAWLERNGYIRPNPFRGVPTLREPNREIIRVLTRQDIQAVMDTAKGNLRNRAIVATLLDTGIRAGELANLCLYNLDGSCQELQVSGKTGPRTVPIFKALRFISAYVSRERVGGTNPSLFTTRTGDAMTSQTVTLTVRRLGLKAEIGASKVGPHIYRHTFAVEYLRNGGDVFSLMRILGHSNIKTTEKYVQWLAQDVASLHRTKSPASRWL